MKATQAVRTWSWVWVILLAAWCGSSPGVLAQKPVKRRQPTLRVQARRLTAQSLRLKRSRRLLCFDSLPATLRPKRTSPRLR